MKQLVYIFIITSLLGSTAYTQATWTKPASGTTNELYTVFFINSTVGWIAGDGGKILKSTDGGTTWTPQISGKTSRIKSIHFATTEVGWAVGMFDGILKTTDGGTTWTTQSHSTVGVDYQSVVAINSTTALIIGNDNNVSSSTSRVIKTTDGGTTWLYKTQKTGYPRGLHFFSGTAGWFVCGFSGSWKTTDVGESWTASTPGNVDRPTSVFSISTDQTWIVGYTATAAKTINGGSNWSNLTTGAATTTTWNDVHFLNAATGYIAGSSGIRKTTDSGSTWSAVTLPATNSLNSIHFTDENNGWAVGTSGTILKYSQTLNGFSESTIQPNVFSLEQNYPNPFNPATTISFSLPSKRFTSLKIYDVIGREIATLVNSEIEAGNHAITWNTSSLSSGAYIYKLSSGENTSTKRMVLQK